MICRQDIVELIENHVFILNQNLIIVDVVENGMNINGKWIYGNYNVHQVAERGLPLETGWICKRIEGRDLGAQPKGSGILN